MRVLALALLVGCAVDEVEIEEPPAIAADLTDGGFGFSCRQDYSPKNLVTYCYSNDGEVGICAQGGVCFPKCTHADRGCPAGHIAVQTIGLDDDGVGNCICYPRHCADPLLAATYGYDNTRPMNCAAVDRAP